MKTISIIGYGNVGETLAKYINNYNKLDLSFICSKHFNDKTIFSNTKIFPNISQINSLPDIVFITSKDKQIENIATTLAETFKEKLLSKTIIHTSGTYSLEVLSACEKFGANCVAAHPFQTFFSKNISCLNNIFWGIEINNEKYYTDIKELIQQLNGHPFLLPTSITKNKALYHSIAVAVSNYMAGAIKLGTLIANEIKLPQKDFLIPIINTTIENCVKSIIENDNNFPLTGPIIRGDNETIEKHIEALKMYPNLQKSYIEFANGLYSIANTNKEK